jgi:arginyl-tRNA synthetase
MENINNTIIKAITESGFDIPTALFVTRPKEEFGDYSTNVALSIAKQAGKTPREVAEAIAEKLKNEEGIASVEIAGPGFINLRINNEWLEKELTLPHSVEKFLDGRRYIVDYSSPNIAKPMHVGHFRTTMLGQVLVNLYRYLGADVTAWSYPGDWGTQFGKLIVAWKKWGNREDLEAHPINELLRIYVKFHKEAKEDPKLETEARAELKLLQDNEPEAIKLWKEFSEYSKIEFDRMFNRLGVKFDVWRGESYYHDKVRSLVEKIKNSGVAIKSDGAYIISLDNEKLPPFLIEKSDGTTLYATHDLALMFDRVANYHPDEIVFVVGNEQTLHFQQLFPSVQKLAKAGVYGADFKLPKLYHVSYGFFRLASGKMSTREGEIIRLEDLLNEAVVKAKEMLAEKSPDLDADALAKLAETIGVGAVVYTDLVHDRHTDVVFDWDNMFSFDGNSIIYLLYTFARCNSLLKWAEDLTPTLSLEERGSSGSGERRWTENEKSVFLTSLELNEAIKKSVAEYDPHHILNHAYKLAAEFSRFYNSDTILKSPKLIRSRRLEIVQIVQEQLKFVFDLLGVEAPTRL